MECLVDDTVNSNLLPSCPSCSRDTSLTIVSTSDLVTQCQNCRESDNCPGVDNSPTLQTHRDVISPSNETRPRCCSCVENSTASPFLATQGIVGTPLARPRSASSPPQRPHQDQTSASEPDTLDTSSCQNSSSNLDQPGQTHKSTSFQGITHVQQYSEDNLEPAIPPIYSNQPPKESPDGSNLSSFPSDGDTSIRDTRQQACLKCGGVVLSGVHDSGLSERTLSSTNINTQQNLSQGVDISSNDSLSTDTIHSHDESRRENIGNSGPCGVLLKTRDVEIKDAYSSSERASADKSIISQPDSEVPKPGHDSQTVHLTSSQIISHNMKVNRITTARARRTNYNARSYRKAPTSLHMDIATSRATSRSYHATGEIPRIVTPDCPMGSVPSEMLYALHSLGHENEDLSADVVYSLHFRDYQIHELLGKGISSTVRRVTEKSTGAEFAVKIIDISGEKVEMAQVEQVKKDTSREIKILRMCAGHSNIIELHDVFETPTFIFLVFEICRKGELFDYLTSVVSLSEKRTRIFMRQLIEAVAFVHDKNIVHRDLKPENILLDDDLNIKVSDFGFATVIEPGEELTELCGTPGYLAPEVLAHSMYENVSGYSKEVDMWACGVIMYTLLCGAPPFWNRRQMMMLRAIMNADYTFNTPEWDDITDTPKNLIQKLLVVNPKDRLTAKEALQHPFFHSQVKEEKKFKAHRKFRAAVTCVMFYLRLSFSYKNPPPISVNMIKDNPYCVKVMRKVIDTCAFSMYKHWVKRVDNQNRAALFEHTLRDDWKHNPMTVDGIPMVVDSLK